MSFNVSNVKVSQTLPLVYGICKYTEVLPYVNLNNEEKQKLNIRTFEKESEYLVEKEDKEGNKYKSAIIELYFRIMKSEIKEVEGAVYPVRFYVDNIQGTLSSSGKVQYINKSGEAAWLLSKDDEENAKWLSNKEGLRYAYRGEVDFMNTLKEMFHISSGIEIFNWENVFKKGDFAEIKNTIKSIKLYLQGKLTPEQNKNIERPFEVLFYITSKTKEVENDVKTYFSQNIYTKAFGERRIRKTIEKNETSYPLQGTYKKDGIITNYLNIFENKDNGIDKENEEVGELPF